MTKVHIPTRNKNKKQAQDQAPLTTPCNLPVLHISIMRPAIRINPGGTGERRKCVERSVNAKCELCDFVYDDVMCDLNLNTPAYRTV